MKRRFNNLFEFYLPTTHTFHEKLLLKKGSILGNKDLALGSVIEGIPNRFLRVSYEDAFFRFGFEFIRLKFLHINFASQTLRNDSLGLFPNHNSYGVFSTDLDG